MPIFDVLVVRVFCYVMSFHKILCEKYHCNARDLVYLHSVLFCMFIPKDQTRLFFPSVICTHRLLLRFLGMYRILLHDKPCMC